MCWNGSVSPMTGRSVWPALFPGCAVERDIAGAAGTATITEALRAVGVDDYLRQQTRVTARLPTQTEADLFRMPRNRPVLITEKSTSIVPGRSSNSRPGATPRRGSKSSSNHEGCQHAYNRRNGAAGVGRNAEGGSGRQGRPDRASTRRVAASIRRIRVAGAAGHRRPPRRRVRTSDSAPPRRRFSHGPGLAGYRIAAAGERNNHGVSWRYVVVGTGIAQPDRVAHAARGVACRSWTCDMRVHLRWEAYNLEALETA